MDVIDISVIMSVYNTRREYLCDAIDSILNQTYKNFEFIIIDDGSNEETKAILEEYHDDRIKVVTNEKNIGLTKSLNIGLSMAQGKYIARMDADDISVVNRLELQYNYMEEHSDIAVLGGWTSAEGKVFRHDGKLPSECRKVRMLFQNNGISHPTAFIRKAFLEEHNICYDESILKSQDYMLWVDILLANGKLEVLSKVLLDYRIHDEQISKTQHDEQNYYVKQIRKKQLILLIDECSQREEEQFLNFSETILSVDELKCFFDKIRQENGKKNIYDSSILLFELVRMWYKHLSVVSIQDRVKSLLTSYTIAVVRPDYIRYRIMVMLSKKGILI